MLCCKYTLIEAQGRLMKTENGGESNTILSYFIVFIFNALNNKNKIS